MTWQFPCIATIVLTVVHSLQPTSPVYEVDVLPNVLQKSGSLVLQKQHMLYNTTDIV